MGIWPVIPGPKVHKPSIASDPVTHRVMIQCACTSIFISEPLYSATFTQSQIHRDNAQMFKCKITDLRRFRSGHYSTLRRWRNPNNRSEKTISHKVGERTLGWRKNYIPSLLQSPGVVERVHSGY